MQDKQDDRDQKKLEQKVEKQEKDFDPTGRPEDGRPKNSRDKQKRKQREVWVLFKTLKATRMFIKNL